MTRPSEIALLSNTDPKTIRGQYFEISPLDEFVCCA